MLKTEDSSKSAFQNIPYGTRKEYLVYMQGNIEGSLLLAAVYLLYCNIIIIYEEQVFSSNVEMVRLEILAIRI